jgi:hypothetical protein
MISLSANHESHDDQIADVVSFLSQYPEYQTLMDAEFLAAFPEYNSLTWFGSWMDAEASGVDPDYMSWVADWIEANTPVRWEDGEPFLPEKDDHSIECRLCVAGEPMDEHDYQPEED